MSPSIAAPLALRRSENRKLHTSGSPPTGLSFSTAARLTALVVYTPLSDALVADVTVRVAEIGVGSGSSLPPPQPARIMPRATAGKSRVREKMFMALPQVIGYLRLCSTYAHHGRPRAMLAVGSVFRCAAKLIG